MTRDSKLIGTIRLEEAAHRLGCHVETLRIRVRDGRLLAVRGQHGAYYVAEQNLAELPRPRRGGPSLRTFTRAEIESSWELTDAILGAKEWANREKALLAELRVGPAISQGLYRLVSVHRLRKLGMAFEDIAEELGISARHARRLIKRRLFIALRRHLTKVDQAVARRERELAKRQARTGRRRGWRWRRRAD